MNNRFAACFAHEAFALCVGKHTVFFQCPQQGRGTMFDHEKREGVFLGLGLIVKRVTLVFDALQFVAYESHAIFRCGIEGRLLGNVPFVGLFFVEADACKEGLRILLVGEIDEWVSFSSCCKPFIFGLFGCLFFIGFRYFEGLRLFSFFCKEGIVRMRFTDQLREPVG